jgi:hypothetical protein
VECNSIDYITIITRIESAVWLQYWTLLQYTAIFTSLYTG